MKNRKTNAWFVFFVFLSLGLQPHAYSTDKPRRTNTKIHTDCSEMKVKTNFELPLLEGQKGGQIVLEISGGQAPYRYEWTHELAEGQSVRVLPSQEGTAHPEKIAFLESGTYCVDVTDYNHCMISHCVQIKPSMLSMGTKEKLHKYHDSPDKESSSVVVNHLKVYPNPFNRQVYIDLNLVQEESLKLKLVDALGKLIHSEKKVLAKGKHKWEIEIDQNIPDQLLFLEITTANGEKWSEKVVHLQKDKKSITPFSY